MNVVAKETMTSKPQTSRLYAIKNTANMRCIVPAELHHARQCATVQVTIHSQSHRSTHTRTARRPSPAPDHTSSSAKAYRPYRSGPQFAIKSERTLLKIIVAAFQHHRGEEASPVGSDPPTCSRSRQGRL